MEAADAVASPPRRSAGRRLADLFHGRPRLQVGALLAGPVGWLVIGYLGSLAVMLVAAFWQVGAVSGEVERTFSLDNFQTLAEEPVYRSIAGRTILIAALVTVTDALLAFPIAFYMAKVASPRMKALLVVAVLMPLWSSYLVKVYAWRTMLSSGGILNWALDPFGLDGPGYGNVAVWLVMSYLWLPFMIIPIFAGLERIPDSLLSASEDMGAKPFTTFRRVILPLAFPAVVAGSIFTFSLTLGDYITPILIGGAGSTLMGNVVYNFAIGGLGNLPFAAAFAAIPLFVMGIYLVLAKRTGAFDAM
jgi:putative spermidine/putrescine transport system permease protein